MKFGPVPLDEARGAIMAHSQRVGDRMADGHTIMVRSDDVAPPLQPHFARQRLVDTIANAGNLGIEGVERK